MATGILNPQDNANTTATRPTHINSAANERRWFQDGEHLTGRDLNMFSAQFRGAGDFFSITDTEGDDTYLRQIVQYALYGQGSRDLTDVATQSPALLATDYCWRLSQVLTAARTVALPSPVGCAGRRIPFIDAVGGVSDVNTLTFTGTGVNVSGAALTLRSPYAILWFVSDGAIWMCENSLARRRNYIRNPSFDAWIGPTSVAGASSGGFLDALWKIPTDAGRTYSQVAGFNGAQHALRMQRDSGNAATNVLCIAMPFPTELAYQLAVTATVLTVSADLRAGANFSAASGTVSMILCYGTGIDEAFSASTRTYATGPGNSGATVVTSVSTTGARFGWPRRTIAAGISELALCILWTPVGTAGAADYLDITKLKMEIGSTMSAFEPEPVTESWAHCRRYYERLGGIAAHRFVSGGADSTTHGLFVLGYTPKYRLPTITPAAAANFELKRQGGATVAATALASTASSVDYDTCELDATVASGLTAGEWLQLKATGTSGVIDIDARK
jgi:hypothetical protein